MCLSGLMSWNEDTVSEGLMSRNEDNVSEWTGNEDNVAEWTDVSERG